jgi:asparagine synthase (glutamine-hydrolysing)
MWKITQQGIEKRRYIQALTAVDVERLVASSSQDPTRFVTEFKDLLRESVKLHLVSDVPIAAMCSGGVDSSLIAAYAKDYVTDIPGYVADVAWDDGEGDQAARIGRHLGVPIRRIVVDQACFLELWPYAVWHSDGPPLSPSDSALLAVTRACRSDGIKVLLTGEGSDELFGGHSAHQITFDSWRRLNSWRRLFSRPRGAMQGIRHEPFGMTPMNSSRARRLTVAFGASQALLTKRLFELLAPIEDDADRAFIAHGLHDLHHHLSWILHRHDRLGVAASMEMRVPFLENALFDFAFHLPRRAKLHRGHAKWLVKKAAAELLPADVVYARKKGFPVTSKFSRGTQRLLLGGRLAEVMEWSAEATDEIVANLVEDRVLRFHVVGLELWCRLFFGGEAPDALGEKLASLAEYAKSRPNRPPTRKWLPATR